MPPQDVTPQGPQNNQSKIIIGLLVAIIIILLGIGIFFFLSQQKQQTTDMSAFENADKVGLKEFEPVQNPSADTSTQTNQQNLNTNPEDSYPGWKKTTFVNNHSFWTPKEYRVTGNTCEAIDINANQEGGDNLAITLYDTTVPCDDLLITLTDNAQSHEYVGNILVKVSSLHPSYKEIYRKIVESIK